VQRTTRSVRLTEAGEQLYAAARPALDDLRAAVAAVGEFGGEPHGTLRVQVSTVADILLGGPLLVGFLTKYPKIRLELMVSDAPIDIVAMGYDAGIQLGEVIDQDMIAVPVTGDLRMAVVGAPSYFAHRRPPTHPRELIQHDCINWHPSPDSPPYRWEFTENDREFSVAVNTRVLTTDPAVILRLACAGVGLAIVYEQRIRDELAQGALVSVLDEFCTSFPGYYLYYPQRRQASSPLRALVDYLQQQRRKEREQTGAR
jgi:DNA-binding transcriptional LysR family regulator